MVPRRLLLLLCMLVSVGSSGCSTIRGDHTARASGPPSTQGITFVADGSGDLRQVSDKLAAVAWEAQAPMAVHRVQWSHGKGAVFPDLYDADHHQEKGKALARRIYAYRQAHPNARICLIGYSSGASVALAAAENVPPQTLDRFVLLAPSVAAKHDLRPSLLACKEGIDAFHSEWDVISIVLFAMGTGDGIGLNVAGRSGFEQIGETPHDVRLYDGLRQHFWKGAEQWSGHDGSHFGCFGPEFLRHQVLPKLMGGQ